MPPKVPAARIIREAVDDWMAAAVFVPGGEETRY